MKLRCRLFGHRWDYSTTYQGSGETHYACGRSVTKRRREMTEYERAIDWQERLSPRWWRGIGIAFGVAGVLFIAGGVFRAFGH